MKLVLTIPEFGNIDSSILPTGVPTGGLDKAQKIISVLIEFALVAAVVFALYVIAHAAFNMITSGGDKERFAQGRERLRYSIIGLLIMFSSFFIINLFGQFFGIRLINPPSPQIPPPLSGCAGVDQSCDSIPCCNPEIVKCDGSTGRDICVIPTPTPPFTPILTSRPTPIIPPVATSTPIPGDALTPTPTPKFIMPGQSIDNGLDPLLNRNNTRDPQKRQIDCAFIGGDSSNIKTEISTSFDDQRVYQIGETISFPKGTATAIAIMTVRPGASPTCFNNITCKLISRDTGTTNEPIDRATLGENVCIQDTLSAFFQNHVFPDVNGNRTVFSNLLLWNTAPVQQKASFTIDKCFRVAGRRFFIDNKEVFPGDIQTIPGNGVIGIGMQSLLAAGPTPPLNCSATIQRVRE